MTHPTIQIDHAAPRLHLRPQHAAHQPRHAGARVAGAPGRVAHPDPHPLTDRPDRHGPAGGRRRRSVRGDQVNARSPWRRLRNWSTAAGILVALGVLAMTVGLIRSETAGDLRTLTATGASSTTRRTLTGATAGALALLGALLGTAGAYAALLAWHRSNLHPLTHVPVANLVIILVGLPLIATAAGWLLAGREPVGHRPPATRVDAGSSRGWGSPPDRLARRRPTGSSVSAAQRLTGSFLSGACAGCSRRLPARHRPGAVSLVTRPSGEGATIDCLSVSWYVVSAAANGGVVVAPDL